MTAQPRGLGRGLGALIPSSGGQVPAQGDEPGASSLPGVQLVPVGDIMPNPRQPRSIIVGAALAELADSIRQHGVIQPLILTRSQPTDPVPYQLIAGERRWRAAQLAGLAVVPAVLKEATSQQLLELALVENIQRADLNPLEEAAAYQALMADFGLTQEAVAERVGRSRVAVANILRLLRLPDPVKELLAAGSLTEGHARALLGLPDCDLLLQAAQQVVTRELTVRQTEELVRRLLATAATGPDEPDEQPGADPATQQLEAAFRGALGTKVTLSRGRRGGKLVIHFYSDEELQTIYQQIVGSE
jgi:ParB family transcriptional regulator, chromosome partitioning protein